MVRIALEKMGHTVAQARNGNEALALREKSAFELVITDLIMPDKEGLETIRELIRKDPSTKIIAISGGGRFDASDYLALAKQFGAAYTLAKPFTSAALREVVEKVLWPSVV